MIVLRQRNFAKKNNWGITHYVEEIPKYDPDVMEAEDEIKDFPDKEEEIKQNYLVRERKGQLS